MWVLVAKLKKSQGAEMDQRADMDGSETTDGFGI
jgi:hypothetical protein